jgi:hypothetical protein
VVLFSAFFLRISALLTTFAGATTWCSMA